MRPRSEIIARVRACQKLADPKTNSNEHERAAAAAAAERLIAQYKITPEELGKVQGKVVPRVTVYGPATSAVDIMSAIFKAAGIKPRRGWGEEDDD